MTTQTMTQEELQLLQFLLAKASRLLDVSGSYTDIEIKKEGEELVLIGHSLWVQNAYGTTRKISSKGVEDKEIMIY